MVALVGASAASTTVAGVVTETFYVQNGNNITSYVSTVTVAPIDCTLYVVLGALAFLIGTVTFCLRMYVRLIMVKTFGWDDWVLVTAYIIYVGYVGLYLAIPGRVLHEGLQDAYFDAIGDSNVWLAVYGVLAAAIRLASAAFFLRVVPENTLYKWHRILLVVIVSIYAIFSILVGFLLMAQCGLTKLELDYQITTPRCFNPDTMYDLLFAQSVATAVSDWAMTIIPIVVIFRGAISSRLKWTTAPVIMVASLGGVLAIIRIPFNKLFIIFGPQDMGRYLIWLTLSLYESCIAISSISLVAIRPLLQKWIGTMKTFGYGSASYGGRHEKSTGYGGGSRIQVTTATEITSALKHANATGKSMSREDTDGESSTSPDLEQQFGSRRYS